MKLAVRFLVEGVWKRYLGTSGFSLERFDNFIEIWLLSFYGVGIWTLLESI